MKIIFLILWSVSLLSLPAGLQVPEWVEAEQAYTEGHFSVAYGKYLSLRNTVGSSAALEFNLGNSAMRLNQPDLALAHYRVAQWLDPQDPDIQLNLSKAAEQLRLPPPELPRLRRGFSGLSLQGWSIALPLCAWILTLYLLLGIRMQTFRESRPWGVPLLALMMLLCLCGYWVSRSAPLFHEAVVSADGVTLRFEPLEDATEYVEMAGGEILEVTEELRDWLKVRSGDREGWVPADQVIRLPGMERGI